jgi:hypothetical protein
MNLLLVIFLMIAVLAIVMGIALFFGYKKAEKILGKEAAMQNTRLTLRTSLFTILAIAAIFTVLYLIFKDEFALIMPYVSISFYLLPVFLFFLPFFALMILKKRWVGNLILDVGKNKQHELLKKVAWFELGLGIAYFLFILSIINGSSLMRLQGFSQAISLIFMGLFFFALSQSGLRLYENGIYVMHAFVRWENVKSFKIEQVQQNTLRITYKNSIPFIPGILNVALPEGKKDVVEQLLREKFPILEIKDAALSNIGIVNEPI